VLVNSFLQKIEKIQILLKEMAATFIERSGFHLFVF